LVGEARTEKWRYAAGLNKDGSAKTVVAHKDARGVIIRNFRLEEANEKDPCDQTPEDDAVIAADVVWKEKHAKCAKKWTKKNDNPEKIRVRHLRWRKKNPKKVRATVRRVQLRAHVKWREMHMIEKV
jgi:hypothetical protein